MRFIKIFFITFSLIVFAKFAMPKTIVETKVVTFSNRSQTISNIGTIVASNSTILKSKSSGTVKEIIANSGKYVHKGDVIIQLDDSDEVANLDGSKATYNQKQWLYKKTQKLYQQKAASKLDLEVAKQNYLVAKSDFRIKEGMVSDKKVIAPFDGDLGIIYPHVGDSINKGVDVASLINKKIVWVDFTLPQKMYNNVKLNKKVTIKSTLGREFLSANIIAINKDLSNNHQINVRAKLNNVPDWLPIGSYCLVRLSIGKVRPVILVPLTAVVAQSSVNKVFVVKNNIVEERIVKLGSILDNGQVEILSGITDKESVIVLGGFKVYNGMQVVEK